ncbi:MAG: hypothetical protein IT383_19875 [Deltaproteobacteria bacterium]|nr:hypothetical protein [Deltaproteobacteria bacterium]
MSPVPDAVCAICGAEHDPEESPEVDSTHLCPTCAANERALRDPRRDDPEPLRSYLSARMDS